MSEQVVQRVKDALGAKIKDLQVKWPHRVYVEVDPDDLPDVARCLFSELRARYAIASGMEMEEGFEVLHHFAFDQDHVIVTVRVRADKENPSYESIAPIIEGAEFIEREMNELLGIEFRGHPDMRRLLLPEEWPEGVHPLRRGKPWEGKVSKEL